MNSHGHTLTSSSSGELLSWRASQPIRSTLISQSGSEPVSLAEVKDQLAIARSDTAHDTRLDRLISAARQKYEYDTTTTMLVSIYEDIYESFYDRIRLSRRTATAITSISYYDNANQLQTLSVDAYELDASLQEVRLKVDQSWPNIESRWDAVRVRYTASFATIPETAKHAIILLVCFWFEMADLILSPNMIANQAYESLVAVHQRSTYP